MLEHTLTRKNPALEHWAIPVGIGAIAVLVGLIAGQGLWRYLPAVALFLFYLVASSFRITEKEFDWIVFLTILGGGIAALWSLQQFYSGVGFGQHGIRATLVVGENEANPNRFGIRLLLPLAFAMA